MRQRHHTHTHTHFTHTVTVVKSSWGSVVSVLRCFWVISASKLSQIRFHRNLVLHSIKGNREICLKIQRISVPMLLAVFLFFKLWCQCNTLGWTEGGKQANRWRGWMAGRSWGPQFLQMNVLLVIFQYYWTESTTFMSDMDHQMCEHSPSAL